MSRTESVIDIPAFPSSKDPDERRFRDQVRAALDRVANSGDRLLNVEPQVSLLLEQYDNAGVPTGKVTVQVRDVGNNFAQFVRFASNNEGTPFDFTDPTDTDVWDTSDSAAPYEFEVALDPRFGAVFAVAVPWFPPGANEALWVLQDGGFDYDRRPRTQFGIYLTGGNVYLVWQGDEDTQSVRYVVSTEDAPAAGEVQGGALVASQSSNAELIYSGLAEGETLYVRARGYSTSAGAETDIQSFTDYQEAIERPTTESRVPRGFLTGSASGGLGTATLTLIDPAGVVTEVSYKSASKMDGVAFDDVEDGTWTRDQSGPGFDFTETVALQQKHNAGIAFYVGYDLGEGAGQEDLYFGPMVFDVDTTAEITSLTLSFDTDGSVLFDYRGDDDVAYVKWGASKTDFPTDEHVEAGTGASLDQAGTVNEQSSAANGAAVDTNIVLSPGEVCYVKVIGYTADDEAGEPNQARTNFFDNPDYALDIEARVEHARVPLSPPAPQDELFFVWFKVKAGAGVEEVVVTYDAGGGKTFTDTIVRPAGFDGFPWEHMNRLAESGAYDTSSTAERFTVDQAEFTITATGRFGDPLEDGPVSEYEVPDINSLFLKASSTFAFDGYELGLPGESTDTGTSYTPNMNNGPTQSFVATGAATIALPTNMADGQSMTLLIFTGGNEVSLNGSYVGPTSSWDTGTVALSIWRAGGNYYAVGSAWS